MSKASLRQEEIASLLRDTLPSAAVDRWETGGDEPCVQDPSSSAAATGASCGSDGLPAVCAQAASSSNTTTSGEDDTAAGLPAIAAWWAVAEELAQAFSAILSERLHASVSVSAARVDRLGYGEFLLGQNDRTCFSLLPHANANVAFALDLELIVLFPMIERMLGGAPAAQCSPDRPLTEIEKRLAMRIAEPLLGALRSRCPAGSLPELAVATEGVSHRANPRLAKEPVVGIQWRIAMGASRGKLRLAMSWTPAPSGPSQQAAGANGPSDAEKIPVSVVVARIGMTAGELKDLKVGDVIATQIGAEKLLNVIVDGNARFQAKAGVLEGRKAVRIESHATKRNNA